MVRHNNYNYHADEDDHDDNDNEDEKGGDEDLHSAYIYVKADLFDSAKW